MKFGNHPLEAFILNSSFLANPNPADPFYERSELLELSGRPSDMLSSLYAF
jgi:hypothetical protein